MAKQEHTYALMQSSYPLRREARREKCYYFLCGVTTALVLTFLTGVVYQVWFPGAIPGVRVASGELTRVLPDPPPHQQVARVARYVVHLSDWASIATISTHDPITGFPFANVVSLSDGPRGGEASGVPYMYITHMDLSGKDLLMDNRATLSLSEAQSDYCHHKDYDPEDPRCARVLLSGTVVTVQNGTEEARFAQAAMFSRHPVMASWPQDHHFFFAKLNISHIYVLDFFGGAAEVDPVDYYNADPFVQQ